MLKKIFFVTLFIFSSLVFARDITDIKTLSFNVVEKNLTKDKKPILKYSIDLKLPSTIKKVIYFPELNKGEQYIYKNNKKTVYLPVFNQIRETEVNEDEILIVDAINKILEEYKSNKKFKSEYEAKKSLNIALEDRNSITIDSYQFAGDYILPKKIYILDGKSKIFELDIDNIKTNVDFNDENFTVHKLGYGAGK